MILLSPSKGQDFGPTGLSVATSEPVFTAESEALIRTLDQFDAAGLQQLMTLSPALAERTRAGVRALATNAAPAKPALLAFSGEAFRAMNPKAYIADDLVFAQQQVRILSGLYGCLRPLDRIRPHRLEMATRLPVEQARDLYAFWSERITPLLNRELDGQAHPVLINLASEEYSRVVRKKQVHAIWLDIHFKEESNGRLRSVAVFAKRARGLMTDFCIRNRITAPEGLKRFNGLGYIFRPDLSDDTGWLFTRAT